MRSRQRFPNYYGDVIGRDSSKDQVFDHALSAYP